MKYVEITVKAHSSDTISSIAKREKVQDFRLGVAEEDGMQQMWMLVSDDKLQLVLDALQTLFNQPHTS